VAVAEGRTTPSRGVSRFLAAHEACGSGFQITRTGEPGRPRLRLLCQGCGQRAAYAAGDAGLLGEEAEVTSVETVAKPREKRRLRRRRFAPAEAPKADQAAAPPVPEERPAAASGSNLESWLPAPAALPWWVPNVYILLVIAVGAAMIVFGVIHQQGGDGDSGSSFGTPQPTQTAPPAPEPTAPAPPAQSRPQAIPAAPPARSLRRAKRKLDEVSVLGRFTISAPQGWAQGTSGGAVVFRPDDGKAELRIFLQPGSQPLNRLERDAARFLRQQHGKVSLSRPVALKLGSTKARELRSKYGGGIDTAVVLATGGYSYLLLGEVDSKTPPSLDALTVSSLRSFRAS
jgi:hypothetical protein